MIDGSIVSRKVLAHALGVSDPTISKWVDQGAPCIDRGKKGKPAQFDLRAFIAWWKDHVLGAGAPKPAKLHEREQTVDIETKELKLRQLKAELVPRAAAVRVIDHVMAQCAGTIRQAPRRFGHRFVNLPDMAAAVEVLSAVAEEQCGDLRVPDMWKPLSDAQVELSA